MKPSLLPSASVCSPVKNKRIDSGRFLGYNGNMKNNQSTEDYLECILLLSRESEYVHRVDVARRTGVSQPAVQKAVKILQENGWVECDGMHIYLTKKGEEYASGVFERHCTIKKFLQLHGVNEIDANNDACEMEHALSEATYQMMKNYVSNNK